MKKLLFAVLCCFTLDFLTLGSALAQDSVNVTFRYKATAGAVRAFLPGEFNNFGPNNAGRIATDAVSLMTLDNGIYYKSVRLRVGGGLVSIGGGPVYQYKNHEHLSGSGDIYQWLSDPLNPNTNPADNNNSYVRIASPMIFQMEPRGNAIVTGDQVTATVASKNADSINTAASRIIVNGTDIGAFGSFYNKSRQLLSIPSLASAFGITLLNGTNKIKLVAVTLTGATVSDSVQFLFGTPNVVDAPRPAGLVDGINYGADPTKVTLSLLAPYKRYVYLIGDFNNWEIKPEYLMKRDSLAPDSVRYWLEISGLTAGQEYGFQYLVDGAIRIADPYADKILDPFDDQFIPAITYPNLKPYPQNKTSFAVSVLQTAQTPYVWQVPNFVKPNKGDLVIYELLIRDFVARHDYQTLIDTLNYLQRLGVNAIELMPPGEFEGNSSWGYNCSFYFAPDKYYGTKNDLKRFIDECHKRGIAVLIDAVLNHAFGQSPFVRLYASGDYGPATTQNIYANVTPKHDFNVGVDLNHESKYTKEIVDRFSKYWIEEYKFDGIRFDLSKGFTQVNTLGNTGAWGQYDASRVAIWKRIYDKIRTYSSDAYIILEHFADNSEELELSNYGMMFWGNHNAAYNEATMGFSGNFSGIYYKNRNWNQPNLVGYMESHDEERLMYKNLQFGNANGAYNVKNLPVALSRMKTAGAFFFTVPGPKMIWQFGELGYDVNIDFNGRTGEKPIRWNYLNDIDRLNLNKTFGALIKLKRDVPALFRDKPDMQYDLASKLKRINLSDASVNLTAVGNFDVIAGSVNPNFQSTGRWYDYFSGDSIEVSNTTATVSLQPGEFKIYTTVKLQTPEQGILAAGDEPTGKAAKFELSQNYPNPFNPATTIRFQLAQASNVSLKIYDVLGREVATVLNERRAAGSYTAAFNAAKLSSGVYFYRLQAGSFVETKKMTLIK